MHPLGTGTQFGGGLRATKQEYGEQCDLLRWQVESAVEEMQVLLAALAGTVDGAQQLALPQAAYGEAHGRHVVLHDGVAACGLVTSGEQRVVRQRVLLRRRQLLL